MKDLIESLENLKKREHQIYAENELEQAYRDGIEEGIQMAVDFMQKENPR